MGLLKKTDPDRSSLANNDCTATKESLIYQLTSEYAEERRESAKQLAKFPECVDAIINQLAEESALPVRQALVDSLSKIGGNEVIEKALPLLNSQDAGLRNSVIELFQGFPKEIEPYLQDMLSSSDSDIRIFAIDVLKMLNHPCTLVWLTDIIRTETHVNVLGTAIDRIAELMTEDLVPDLIAAKSRHPDDPYIEFAVDLCIRRLGQE